VFRYIPLLKFQTHFLNLHGQTGCPINVCLLIALVASAKQNNYLVISDNIVKTVARAIINPGLLHLLFKEEEKMTEISMGGTNGYCAVEREIGRDTGSPATMGKSATQPGGYSGHRAYNSALQRV
jgi:hypothetical protein